MKLLNWLGASPGANEESIGDALLAALGCLILAPAAFFGLILAVASVGAVQ